MPGTITAMCAAASRSPKSSATVPSPAGSNTMIERVGSIRPWPSRNCDSRSSMWSPAGRVSSSACIVIRFASARTGKGTPSRFPTTWGAVSNQAARSATLRPAHQVATAAGSAPGGGAPSSRPTRRSSAAPVGSVRPPRRIVAPLLTPAATAASAPSSAGAAVWQARVQRRPTSAMACSVRASAACSSATPASTPNASSTTERAVRHRRESVSCAASRWRSRAASSPASAVAVACNPCTVPARDSHAPVVVRASAPS